MFLSGQPSRWQPLHKLGLAFTLLLASTVAGNVAAKGVAADTRTVVLQQLPAQAQATERLVRSGGPFPYGKDGTVFGNREGVLPKETRGWYREYTVRTPGNASRGARRIVCGGREPTRPQACYYSDDHYTSFRRIVQ